MPSHDATLRYYRVKIWNHAECGEAGYHSYILIKLTKQEFLDRLEFLKSGNAGELVEIVVPRDATEGPWRLVV